MASKAFMDRYGRAHYADEETATFRTAYYAIIIKDNKVLLTALPRFDLFEFPGGGQERGENFRECLQRELYEETGYDFCLSHGKTEIRQVVDFFADDIRPRGECWIYDQTYIVYDADGYGLELREGEWKTPENGRAKWVRLEDLKEGRTEINYCHRLAFEKYLEAIS